jgi:transcriptional regulator with XRE-family HTH domain
MTKLQAIFIENLKYARKKADLTQEALAEKVGVTAKHIGVIERGLRFPPIQLVEALANALGIAPYELFLDLSGVTGTTPEGIIKSYNQFLEEQLHGNLKNAEQCYLALLHEKEIDGVKSSS